MGGGQTQWWQPLLLARAWLALPFGAAHLASPQPLPPPLKTSSYETIMMNSNPETVSTDYDTSSRLYFEPLTVEDVLNVIEKERPEGIIVQVRRALVPREVPRGRGTRCGSFGCQERVLSTSS